MDEADAVDALTRLGLTSYEAQVFVALQKLGTGTASQVDEVADVPRSQVYGAADGLEQRGLLEVDQSTPTRYRPVSLAAAKEKLLRELEAQGEAAFEYLETVEGVHEEQTRRSEAVWTLTDGDAIDARVADVVEAAEDRVFYGVSAADQYDERVLSALEERAAAGTTVVLSSSDPEAKARFEDLSGVVVGSPSNEAPGGGRVVVADRDGVLLSVVGGDIPETEGETAIWSADTAFAAVIVTLIEGWAESHLDVARA